MDSNDYENKIFKKYINTNQLVKVLDDDVLIFTEGSKQENNPDFITKEETDEDYQNLIQAENMSCGDNEIDFANKSNIMFERKKPTMGLFERLPYFNKIFPPLKIQKPGFDIYGITNIFLFVIVIFVFAFFKDFNVSASAVIHTKDD